LIDQSSFIGQKQLSIYLTKKMKLTRFLNFAFVVLSSITPVFAQTGELSNIYQRLYNSNLSQNLSANVKTWVDNLQANGRWTDLNYNTTRSYSPTIHNQRIEDMALAYVKNVSGNVWYQNAALKQKIVLAINDNANRAIYTVFKWSDYSTYNWFDDYIASPANLANALVLLNNSFSDAEMASFTSCLKDYRTIKNGSGAEQFADAGQNLVWISEVSFRKGVLENNATLTQASINSIASTIKIMTIQGGEGIKADNMFHQHGAQVYGGGYGLWYVPSILTNMEFVNGTTYSSVFTSALWTIFRNLLFGGHQWIGYKSNMDFGSMGRNISRPNNTGNISTWDLDRLAIQDPANATSYQAWKTNRSGGVSAVSGNRHFWNSDMMVHRGTNYYLSAKVISNRTDGTETMNGENLKGYNLPLGATNINTRGSEYNNIYPTWDFSRIPGTTAEIGVTYPSPHTFKGSNNFAGGVSDQTAGALSFSSTYQGIESAKSYFFFNDMMLCLGAGINANKTNSIATTLNQCYANGNITISQNDALIGNEQIVTAPLSWLHHDNVGYVLLNNPSVTVERKTRTGSWFDINDDQSKTPQSNIVFTAHIDHGKTPKDAQYGYIVAPNQTVASTKLLSTAHGFQILVNTDTIQAVKYPALGYTAIVFHKAGSVSIGDNNTILTASQACLVLVKKQQLSLAISVSDPLYSQTNLILKINNKLTGAGSIYDANTNTSTLTYIMPQNEYEGKSVKQKYSIPDAWNNKALSKTLTSLHRVSYTVNASTNKVNLVTGLGPNFVDTYDSLACIVRFNEAGIIDVRDGGVYKSDRPMLYNPNTTYTVEIMVDMLVRKYSVSVKPPVGNAVVLATNYDFRTAQQYASILKSFAGFNTNSDPYSLGLPVVTDVIVTATEKENIQKENTFAYPNPFYDQFNLAIQGEFKIYDRIGKLVDKGYCDGRCELGAKYPNGMYYLEWNEGQDKKSVRLIKID
jgi:hypothetical protein